MAFGCAGQLRAVERERDLGQREEARVRHRVTEQLLDAAERDFVLAVADRAPQRLELERRVADPEALDVLERRGGHIRVGARGLQRCDAGCRGSTGSGSCRGCGAWRAAIPRISA